MGWKIVLVKMGGPNSLWLILPGQACDVNTHRKIYSFISQRCACGVVSYLGGFRLSFGVHIVGPWAMLSHRRVESKWLVMRPGAWPLGRWHVSFMHVSWWAIGRCHVDSRSAQLTNSARVSDAYNEDPKSLLRTLGKRSIWSIRCLGYLSKGMAWRLGR